MPWIDQGDWGADDHCKIAGKQVSTISLPSEWTTASDGGRSKAGQMNNNAMGVLLPDNVTIVQMQPAYRCAPGSPLLARFGNSTDGCPQRFQIQPVFSVMERMEAMAEADSQGLEELFASVNSRVNCPCMP